MRRSNANGRTANTSQKPLRRSIPQLNKYGSKNYESKPELDNGAQSMTQYRSDTQNTGSMMNRGNWVTNDRTPYEAGNLQAALGRSLYGYNSQKMFNNDQNTTEFVRNVAAMESAALRSQLLHNYRQSGVNERHGSTGPVARRNGNTIDLQVMHAQMRRPNLPQNMHVIDGVSNDDSREFVVNDDLSDERRRRNFGAQAITGREDQ